MLNLLAWDKKGCIFAAALRVGDVSVFFSSLIGFRVIF